MPSKKNVSILALGAESAGNFSFYNQGKVYFSKDFGDLLEEKNRENYKKTVLTYLKKNKIKPQIVLTDLHPLFNTTRWGAELAQKYGTKHIQVQHHLAHIFSTIGDRIIHDTSHIIPDTFYGIACDGTGYGTDGKIWGGEIFQISNCLISNSPNKIPESKFKISRIGYLENQIMIGGDVAIREPARMLISILSKFLNKAEVYKHIEKYYSRNEFELLYNQLQQNFNCQETSSAGRILDAVSLLLGFCGNERNYKHEPIDLLEKNSTEPYADLKPKIKGITDPKSQITNYQLLITPLFEYLLKYLPGNVDGNVPRDKHRLAATAQFYLAQGVYEILQSVRHPERSPYPDEVEGSSNNKQKSANRSKIFLFTQDDVFFAGGLANNKIISEYLTSKGAYVSEVIPRGDAGISFGQVVYCLLSK
ncbi:MAG: HypF protein [Patescibacteria group bacterium]|nr:HypF protein [Patescibacteria group bacterium]